MIFCFGNRQIDFEKRTLVMGIVNVTPDSFSENGRNYKPEDAIKNGLKFVDDGADILDIGGESTRPGANPVSVDEEIRRVLPVIQGLKDRCSVPLSIDTYKSNVAKIALKNGAEIINDISGFHHDEKMKNVAREFNSGCIAMHMRGTPKTMQSFVDYEDLVSDVVFYFKQTIAMLKKSGINNKNICLDPGIGFSKTVDQNLSLLKHLTVFSQLGHPILVGTSRKSFIGKVLGAKLAKDRIWGTAATVAIAVNNGANIVRVHDVKEMHEVCAITSSIQNAT